LARWSSTLSSSDMLLMLSSIVWIDRNNEDVLGCDRDD
jgi:hypothetical protein